VPDATLALILAGVVVVSLNAYILFAGADFGGGVWDLFASGPRKKDQRELVADALGPIWEANHVWLILIIVILFTCFPPVFVRMSVALHIPLTLMLIGIVLRGSAFTFRSYDSQADDVQRRWGAVFAVASLVTPLVQGMSAGAVIAGDLPAGPRGLTFRQAYVDPWLGPFPLAVGVLTVLLFAFLAAVYLAVEAKDEELKEDFRRRALGSGVLLFPVAVSVLALSREAAPNIWTGLLASGYAVPIQLGAAAAALTTLAALGTRRWTLARVGVIAQTSVIVWGWAIAQYPYAMPPDLHLVHSSAPAITQKLVVGALAAGAIVLFPSLWYLFKVFKGQRASSAR
jgi:cytochrome d ubiquinol oxidase subunit II